VAVWADRSELSSETREDDDSSLRNLLSIFSTACLKQLTKLDSNFRWRNKLLFVYLILICPARLDVGRWTVRSVNCVLEKRTRKKAVRGECSSSSREIYDPALDLA
jgi:hypothetical protein